MRVAFDHQIFSLQHVGGISRYFLELSARLVGEHGCKVSICAGLHRNEYLRAARGLVHGRYVREVRFTGRLRFAANNAITRTCVGCGPPDLLHETYYYGKDRSPGIPRVLTVFDMIHERFPMSFADTDRTVQRKAEVVRKADHIVCISRRTRDDLLEILSIDPERTTVTRLGCSLEPAPAAVTPVFDAPFFLYVGTRVAYKNFDGLLRALGTSERLPRELLLVCAGGGAFTKDELTLAARLGVSHMLRSVVADDVLLAALYRDAAALVYPSFYEGFGLPPLEAMSLRCPVVCGAVGALPEVVGDAAETIDPERPESMAAGMERVLYDEAYALHLRGAGERRARLFSWSSCAQETMNAYHTVLQRG